MALLDTITTDWKELLATRVDQTHFDKLEHYLNARSKEATIYPPREVIFQALNLTPFHEVKVIILGQDPYHGPNQSHGLAFSVQEGIKLPPSLRNIFKELHDDLGCSVPDSGDLTAWAKQGVLLLNTVLTVEEKAAGSHQKIGWERVTDTIIDVLNEKETPVIYMLWGKPAQSKIKRIDSRHKILTAPHPSPLSSYRGFFGSQPFSQANQLLKANEKSAIDWCLV
ncbi:uracil-DNA glycosylase [Halolactibacillus halophilus]|uniref:Uracil-DNA glycosylase n=1 Tax=Halolactibacillus halophilus TaxID=306540 RepID=A0ABQ0VMQ8_9BACI|nr:uracil-DNA glycosylase [Halolactibacillus halophilus]